MMGFGERPTMSADDITDPDRIVDYEIAFLPGSDAFYSFRGFLGERRSLPGRDGPPGARYNTLPGLKPLPAQILDGYWREGNEGDWARYRRQPGERLRPRRFRPSPGSRVPSQPRLPAARTQGLCATVAA